MLVMSVEGTERLITYTERDCVDNEVGASEKQCICELECTSVSEG